ncbi:MAG TPA: nucleoside-diphosphate kinase [Brevibacterium senegalense]|uniref:Nucleoside diphosphate kinase n=1 Tax=Brevibacterium senegalense TaxID=1033736 RepID=A0A921MED0_9MICO|nr:nucleoside-diphosphate kinase [Brevibacterium senegalense]
MSERTLILVKPDGVERGLVGDVLARIERKGYVLEQLSMVRATADQLAAHYAEHDGKPFYQPLVDFMSSGPIVALVASGDDVIRGFRVMAGVSDPTEAAPGTIRGDLARDWGEKVQKNIVHGSDSVESAEREIAIWFPTDA